MLTGPVRVELFAALSEWDMKSASDIKRIYRRFHDEDSFLSDLIDLNHVPEVQRGATWLFKHHCENEPVVLGTAESRSYFDSFPLLEHWESKLHVLQSMPHVAVPETHKDAVHEFLKGCVASEKKLLRAWAYSGLAELASAFPELRDEVTELIRRANDEETAGSIRVRLRKAIDMLA